MFKVVTSFVLSKFNKSVRDGLVDLAINEHRKISKSEDAQVFRNIKILHLNRFKTALLGTLRILLILLAIFILFPTLIYISINHSLFIESPVQGIYSYIDAFIFVFTIIFLFTMVSFLQLLLTSPYTANNFLRGEKSKNFDEFIEMRQIFTSIVVEPVKVSGAVSLDWESFEGVQITGDAEVTLKSKKVKLLFINWPAIPGLRIQFVTKEDAQLFHDLSRKYITEIEENKKIYQNQKEEKLRKKNFEQERINRILYNRD